MITPLHINTPLIESRRLSQHTGKSVMLKMDAMQPAGSFKIRGVGNICQEYFKQGAKCFVCSSGGNAGLAAAYAGRMLGVRVKVIVPHTTLQLMQAKITQEGAEVIVEGNNWNEADKLAREIAKEKDTYYIPPFDHPSIWKGNSTLIHEVAATGYKPDAVVVCVGGGGLFCGLAEGMEAVGWHDVPIITAETEGAASLAKSISAKQLVTLDKIDTIATSLGSKRVAEKAFEWTQKRPVFAQVVSDKDTVEACARFLDEERVLVEPACGASLAILYKKLDVLKDYNNILVIVCGGNGVSLEILDGWKKKFGI